VFKNADFLDNLLEPTTSTLPNLQASRSHANIVQAMHWLDLDPDPHLKYSVQRSHDTIGVTCEFCRSIKMPCASAPSGLASSVPVEICIHVVPHVPTGKPYPQTSIVSERGPVKPWL